MGYLYLYADYVGKSGSLRLPQCYCARFLSAAVYIVLCYVLSLFVLSMLYNSCSWIKKDLINFRAYILSVYRACGVHVNERVISDVIRAPVSISDVMCACLQASSSSSSRWLCRYRRRSVVPRSTATTKRSTHDAPTTRYMLSSGVSLSVRLSVTSQCSIETTGRIELFCIDAIFRGSYGVL